MGLNVPELLTSIDQIDPAWLQSVFQSAGLDLPTIKGTRIEPLGQGNTGVTVKVLLEYETQGAAKFSAAPASVVCKFHPPDQERLDHARSNGVFQIEANALKLLAEYSEAAVPECYFVAVAEDGGTFNLVSEDLSVSCELGDQIAGCSIADAEATVLELAKLHRQFWKEPLLNDLDWVRPRPEIPENTYELLKERLTSILDAEQCETVKESVPLVLDWLKMRPINRTLIHSDCRVDNILFDRRDLGSSKAYLIDFALVTIGDATADVAYFLTSSVSTEDRLACEMDLLALHTREIAKKDPTYTLEIAIEAYRQNIVSSLFLTLLAALHMPDTPHSRVLLMKLFERNCAAVSHWSTSSNV